MKYNISHQHKVIIFWLPKSGAMSLIKWMIHLKLQNIVDGEALAKEPLPLIHKIFRNAIFESKRPKVDYSSFKKVFFGRNPFHRIVSCYLDKYVCQTSETPKEKPDAANYKEFLELLSSKGLTRASMQGIVNFDHFCSAKDDIGWEFYRELGKPEFDFISLLPETGLPEGNLTHHYKSIQELHKLLGLEDTYESVRLHFEGHEFSHDSNGVDERRPELVEGMHLLSVGAMQRYLEPEWSRRIDYKSFYPSEMARLFEKLYCDEFAFYRQIGLQFSTQA